MAEEHVQTSNKSLFLELARPDENGFSRIVTIEEFTGKYESLRHNNGASWCRKESTLCSNYKVVLFTARDTKKIHFDATEEEKKEIQSMSLPILQNQYSPNKIVGYKLFGKHENAFTNAFRQDIKRVISKLPCRVLFTSSNVEVDHKNGRKNDPKVMNVATQKIEDFQPLSKSVNDAKRQHCKNCKETGLRFDARRLHFSIGFTSGDENFGDEKNPDGCVGCYWFDIEDFNKKVSKV
jgi:hypothetical protein